MDNYMSPCIACNFRKGIMSIEQFREELFKLQERLKTQNNKFNYNIALRYGLTEEKRII